MAAQAGLEVDEAAARALFSRFANERGRVIWHEMRQVLLDEQARGHGCASTGNALWFLELPAAPAGDRDGAAPG